MAALLRRETNVSSNYLMAMCFSGAVAAGVRHAAHHHWAMVIAPGFEPIIRVPSGLLAKEGRAWRTGLQSTAAGYGALLVGAAAATLMAMLISPTSEGELINRQWVQ